MGWLADADLVFPNEDEQGFLALDGDRIVLTRGAAGATFRGDEVPALSADVVDTTGAGDAFCAGFLSEWTAGGDAESALLVGTGAAASCVAKRGARPVTGDREAGPRANP